MKRMLCLLVLLTIGVSLFSACGFSEKHPPETIDVQIEVTYGQTEAREMLALINNFRAHGDDSEGAPWYWEKTRNTEEKVYLRNLAPLTYDYDLEKIAMQRAAELAVRFSHTRPNGESCFRIEGYWGTYGAVAENVAAGYPTAAEAFIGWAEHNESYERQDHRRNMLTGTHSAIGIAHLYCNGTHFWVQEYGDSPRNTTPEPANDAAAIVSVDVAGADFGLSSSVASIDAMPETAQSLPMPTLTVRTVDSFMDRACPIHASLEWQVEDDSIADISGTELIIKEEGITNLIGANRYGQYISIPLTAERGDLSEAVITLDRTACTYTGSPRIPNVTVLFDSLPLEADRNYTVSFENNTNVGVATVIVTGKGSYKGSIPLTFTIIPVKTTISRLAADSDSIKVTWEKQGPQVSGYQIQYCTKKDFSAYAETITVNGSSVTSRSIRNLTPAKTYYVRIRTYATTGGNTFYSAWSDAKRVATKAEEEP